MSKQEILIIDDEPQIRKLLEINLEANGYQVWMAENGKQGIQMAAHHPPELILLDINLPDVSGQEVLKQMRTWYSKSILMLSALDEEEEIVKALDAGATDYITKPFRTSELLARIRSAIRRNQGPQLTPVWTFGELQIQAADHVVTKKGEVVKLTQTEFQLLVLLAKNQGRVLTHQFILKEIWGVSHQMESQYLRVFVGTLRKKLEDDPSNPKWILTENRIGYRFA